MDSRRRVRPRGGRFLVDFEPQVRVRSPGAIHVAPRWGKHPAQTTNPADTDYHQPRTTNYEQLTKEPNPIDLRCSVVKKVSASIPLQRPHPSHPSPAGSGHSPLPRLYLDHFVPRPEYGPGFIRCRRGRTV